MPDKVRCLWKTFNYNDSLHLAIGQITRPPNKSLYLSMALCVDHLVGGGNPIYAAVFSSDHCCWVGRFGPFFLQNVNFVYVRNAGNKFQPFEAPK